ncbi:P-loop containing nucleoside triphosphate hydrolase protein [Astrocystis sublimbata]|nr:P-loop containing nucleoside triphosphate hydrolase protein [Astrocystis sublimbata]
MAHNLWTSNAHDFGLVKDVLERWSSGLDITRLGSIAACASVAPVAWRFIKGAWRESYSWIRQFLIASVTVPGRDPLNRNVMSWVMANVVQHRGIRSFTARTQVHAGDLADRAALLKKKRREVQYLPHFETTFFWHGSCLYFISRSLDNFHASMSDPSYDGIGNEELTLGCLGWSTEPIKRLVHTCQEYADRQTEFFVIIYARDRYGMSWQPKARKPIRRVETVHFDDALKQALLADIRKYLDPATKRLYQSRSMPYRRGYLFFGPPGTGKSSLATALAGEFGLDLYEVKIPCVASDQDLEQMFQEIPPQCIVLLEDVDAIWNRDSDKDEGQAAAQSKCTLSGLLGVIDGVGSAEGRIVIMTTNKPDRLDSALVRPGRVDMKILLGPISQKSAQQMFIRMFTPDAESFPLPTKERHDPRKMHREPSGFEPEALRELALQFSSQVPEDTFTPSQLQGFFQLHLNDATEAVASIASWIENELSQSTPEDDMSVLSDGKSQ